MRPVFLPIINKYVPGRYRGRLGRWLGIFHRFLLGGSVRDYLCSALVVPIVLIVVLWVLSQIARFKFWLALAAALFHLSMAISRVLID